jgi:hypothetical protein
MCKSGSMGSPRVTVIARNENFQFLRFKFFTNVTYKL